MSSRKANIYKLIAVLIFHFFILTGCGESENNGPTMADIPIYPGVETGQSMEQQIPGGFMGGALKQYKSSDSFDDVVSFYTSALEQYETQAMSHTSELGQQTAISISKPNGVITIAIQEFVAEDIVNITLMEVGN